MAFRLPDLTRCCFVFRLRTGALIVGYFATIVALLNLMTNITVMIMVSRVATDTPPASPPAPHPSPDQPHITKATALKIYITYGLQTFVYAVHFTVSLLLVIGVHKNIPRYLRYFFIYGTVILIFDLVLICVAAIFNGFFFTFGQLIVCAFQFYFLLVVRSAHTEMVQQSKPADVEMSYQPAPVPAQAFEPPPTASPLPAPPEQAAPLLPNK